MKGVRPHCWVLLLAFLVIFGCTKEIVVAQETRIVDTVYVTDSKIYTDTLHISDTLKEYVRKYDNPVIRQNIADPSIIRADNGIYYLFSTESQTFPNVPIYKSIDLVNWYFVGSAFNDVTRPVSFYGNIWAPDINYINGQYVMYYSMSKWGGEWDCGIGVSVSEYPWGPFREYSKLFDSRQISVQNSIDPFYIEDGNRKFLFWGSHHGIYGIELSEDGLSIQAGAEKFQIAGNGGEGTYIHKRNGYYYLFVSIGSCCNGLSSTYKVVYGRSERLQGPYYDRQNRSMMEGNGSVLLSGNAFVAGPGHNAEFIMDDAGVDWILYHGYLRSEPELSRLGFLDRIFWQDDWPYMEKAPSNSFEIPFFVDNNNN